MATGTTTKYFLPYPLSTDPVRVAGDIEQLATKIDLVLEEEVQDTAAAMWTGGTFTNGINTPVYNDSTGKISMSLVQDISVTASPTFTGLNINGSSIVFEGSSSDEFETTFVITNPTADRTITFKDGSGTVPFASDVHFIGTTSIALNRTSGAQSLTGITSIDGSAATLTTGRTIAMTGDVVWTSPSFDGSTNVTSTATIQNDAVTYSKIQNVSSQYRVLGRISASAGDVEELTPNNIVTLINQASNAIAATEGGTGQTSYTTGDILYASSSSALAKLAGVATGNALISGGVGSAPSWGKIGLGTHVSGTLSVSNGGTGATTAPPAGSVVYGDGASFVFTSVGSAGQVLTSNGSGAPTWAALPGASTITISGDATGSGTDSITLTLANSGVTAATYGSATSIPIIQVDSKGRITSASSQSIDIDPMPQILMMAGM